MNKNSIYHYIDKDHHHILDDIMKDIHISVEFDLRCSGAYGFHPIMHLPCIGINPGLEPNCSIELLNTIFHEFGHHILGKRKYPNKGHAIYRTLMAAEQDMHQVYIEEKAAWSIARLLCIKYNVPFAAKSRAECLSYYKSFVK